MNPVTPMRQIPGAFINTPAPGNNTVRRRLNFNEPAGAGVGASGPLGSAPASMASNLGSAPPDIGTGMPPPSLVREDLPPIAKAALVVNQTLQLDESYPDLDSYCRRRSRRPTPLHSFHRITWAKTNTCSLEQLAPSRTTTFSIPTHHGLPST